MKGVIMAGGFGTRLKPLTINRPKPMVPVANLPMMHHIVGLLKRHGITDLVSILYFQPDHITDYFGDGSAFGVKMEYITAEADYGTAGAVRNGEELVLDDRVIVISGDVLTDFDLTAAIREHEERGAEATIALTAVENPLAFGGKALKTRTAIDQPDPKHILKLLQPRREGRLGHAADFRRAAEMAFAGQRQQEFELVYQ